MRIDSKYRRKTWIAYGLLAALWLTHVVVNFVWLKVDTRPPFWDTAGQAITTISMSSLPVMTDLTTALHGFFTWSIYPPLMNWLSAPLAFFLWPTVDVFTGIHALFLGILLLSTYGLANTFGGRKAGLLAAFIVSMYPLIYGLARHYLSDVPLVAMVALSAWLLVRTQDFERRNAAVLYGASLGLGLLTKWAFVIFASGPLLVMMVRALKARSREKLHNLLLAFVVGAVIALPWYAFTLRSSIAFFQRSSIFAQAEGDPIVGTLESWSYYARAFVTDQVMLPLALLFVIGLVVWLVKRRFCYETAFFSCWIGIAYLLSSFFFNKDVRYTMPYLPAVAVITALGLLLLKPRVLRTGLITLLVLYTSFQFFGSSFGFSRNVLANLLPGRVAVQVGSAQLPVYAEGFHIASPPQVEDWPVQAILHDMVQSSPERADVQSLRLAVLPDAPKFEQNTFKYFVASERFPVVVINVVGVVEIHDAREQVSTSDFVITKTGDLGPAWTLQQSALFTEELRDPSSEMGRQFELTKNYPLPDGSVAELYRHIP